MTALLSVDDVAAQLGCSASLVRKLVLERRIEFVKVGALVRFTQTAVDEFVQQRTQRPAVPSLETIRRRARRVAS